MEEGKMKRIDLLRICEGGRNVQIRSGSDVANLLQTMKGLEVEVFVAVHLDGKNRVKKKNLVSLGSLNSSIVHPREVFCEAVRERAAALIVAHNHPSGDQEPSQEDLEVTLRLVEAGKLLGIPILDHVIIGESYFSFLEHGLLTTS